MKLKTFIFATGLLFLISSCDKDTCSSQTGIAGEWKLIEELMDPGDGSGTFEPVSSNKEIKFFGNGTFKANGRMCFMGNEANGNHEGTYDASLETFEPENCMSMMPMGYHYSVSGNTLILTYQCFEGCQQKYSRI